MKAITIQKLQENNYSVLEIMKAAAVALIDEVNPAALPLDEDATKEELKEVAALVLPGWPDFALEGVANLAYSMHFGRLVIGQEVSPDEWLVHEDFEMLVSDINFLGGSVYCDGEQVSCNNEPQALEDIRDLVDDCFNGYFLEDLEEVIKNGTYNGYKERTLTGAFYNYNTTAGKLAEKMGAYNLYMELNKGEKSGELIATNMALYSTYRGKAFEYSRLQWYHEWLEVVHPADYDLGYFKSVAFGHGTAVSVDDCYYWLDTWSDRRPLDEIMADFGYPVGSIVWK